MILGVGNEQLAVLNPHALRAAQALVVDHLLRSLQDRLEIGLAQFDIRRLIDRVGNRLPDHDAIVGGIRHRQDLSVGCNGGRQAKASLRNTVGIADEIRLAQHHAGLSDAHRAARDKRPDGIERAGEILGRKLEDPVVDRYHAGAVRIGREQNAVRVGYPAHRSQQNIGRSGLLCGEGALPDNQARALAGDKIGGQAQAGTQ